MNQSCFLRAEFITPGICFQSNYTILRLDIADNPSKPCLSCTKQWCLNQNLPICAGASLGDTDPDTATGKEGDVEARCFRERWILLFSIVPVNTVCIERDSPRDQLVVTLFLLTVFGLLLGAGIKHRMEKAGLDTSLPTWSSSRRWWEVCTGALNDFLTNSLFMQTWVPYGQYDNIGLGQRTYSRSRERNYVGLPGSPRWAMKSSMMYTYIMSWFTGILGLTIEQLIPVPQVSSGFTHWASYALCDSTSNICCVAEFAVEMAAIAIDRVSRVSFRSYSHGLSVLQVWFTLRWTHCLRIYFWFTWGITWCPSSPSNRRRTGSRGKAEVGPCTMTLFSLSNRTKDYPFQVSTARHKCQQPQSRSPSRQSGSGQVCQTWSWT